MLGKRRLVLVVTALASYYVSRDALRQQIIDSGLPLTADNIYSEIQKDLLPPIFVSSMMAQDTFLRDWALGGEKDVGKVTHYLREVRDRYDTVSAFFVSERTRNYYHPKGIVEKVERNDPTDKWYFRVRSMTPDYEINVDADQANHGTLTVFINHKVFDFDGNFIGATGVGLKVSAMLTRVAQYEKRYGRRIFFVDRSGRVTLGTAGAHVGADIHGMPGLGAYAEQILSSSKTSIAYTRDGESILLNTRYIPEFHWYLLVAQNERTITSDVRKALILNLTVGLAVAAMVVLLVNLTMKGYQRRLERMATIDPLTGTATRQAFEMLAEQIIRDASRDRDAISVIFFDLDHFKQVNDRFGHLVGDEVLRGVVDITRDTLRAADVVSRWGGEEFVLWLRACPRDEAARVAEKVREAVKRRTFIAAGEEFHITVSLGVAEYQPGESVEQTLARVDHALYAAKANGRDRVEVVT